jgi:hypothetical protein
MTLHTPYDLNLKYGLEKVQICFLEVSMIESLHFALVSTEQRRHLKSCKTYYFAKHTK